MTTTTAPLLKASERSETLKVAFIALALGIGLVFVAGFAHPELIHEAAHDVRHSLSFPCH
jgi:cobalt transporter subunit CbtB